MKTKDLYAILIGILAMGFNTLSFGQLQPKTIQLNAMLQASVQGQPVYRLQLTPVDADSFKGEIYDGMENLKVEGQYVERNGQYIEDGYFKYYFPSGSVESEGMYQAGVKVGNWKRFDYMGNRKQDRYYPSASANLRRESRKLDISTEN
ncbi:MAG: toxin-antitoxin system YwqK family antitoxin [Flavobacteriales bacterium]